MSKYQYENIKVDIYDKVAHVQLNRPKKLNAFNPGLIDDVGNVFRAMSDDKDLSVIVVSGSGRMFTAGLDLGNTGITLLTEGDPARLAYNKRAHIKHFQDAFTAIEKCEKPVIAAVHNGCYGAGVDLITACDIRYCTKDALFCVKEVDVGLAADVGTLQRLPKVMGNQSLVRELCLSARNLYAPEAFQHGLVSRVFDKHEEMIAEALKMGALIASKSPVAVLGTKHNLIYSRDHTVSEGLDYILTWNSAMLTTEDIPKSFEAFVTKEKPVFSKL
ncbi:ClpP/crotonase-like domain-containing protein [Halteromyces radiatus]|uniref:ClpP/crotonase-like domain-containing protein n=1 Tax=Halteromyces radiatus TaxID=101107 RepID=UPI00222068A0|nr:ClpP/crotonase-like domain-containing protein [Halteromyces radiatus]KAI8082759.1 ClpP/crotonase-like domain-containing protein [Halteromyces radiatus]